MKNIDEKELSNLFGKMRNGDKEAFNDIYGKYYKLVETIAFSILKNKDNSEDVAQNVFKKIFVMEEEKFPKSNSASWLYTVTKNEAFQSIRKHKNVFDIDEVYSLVDENDEVAHLIDKEKYNKMITPLNNQEKDIVSLKVLSNFTFKEISEILGIPMGTVQWKYYKSVYTLKLMISNISMFIITIVAYVFNKRNLQDRMKSTYTKEETPKTQDTIEKKEENATSEIESINNISKINEEPKEIVKIETTENTEKRIDENYNYINIGILTISGIFLFFSIIFAIIFIKHQQKGKKKSSK